MSMELLKTMCEIHAPAGNEVEGTVDYALTIALEPTQVVLKGGLTATADIIIQDLPNVLFIPVETIVETPDGNFADVMNETTGNIEKRPITVGIKSYQFAEVQSGLREGERIVVPKPKLQTPSQSNQPPRPRGGFMRGG